MSTSKFSLRSSYFSLILAFFLLIPINPIIQWIIAIPQITITRVHQDGPFEPIYLVEEPLFSPETQMTFILLATGMLIVLISLFLFILVRFSASITITDQGVYLSRKFGINRIRIPWFEIALVKCQYMRAARGGFYGLQMTITTTQDHNHVIKFVMLSLGRIEKFCDKVDEFTKQPSITKIERSKSFFVTQTKIFRCWNFNHTK
jgi:hypothetical protein